MGECVRMCVFWFSAHLIINIYAIREQIVYDVLIFNYMLLDYSHVCIFIATTSTDETHSTSYKINQTEPRAMLTEK